MIANKINSNRNKIWSALQYWSKFSVSNMTENSDGWKKARSYINWLKLLNKDKKKKWKIKNNDLPHIYSSSNLIKRSVKFNFYFFIICSYEYIGIILVLRFNTVDVLAVGHHRRLHVAFHPDNYYLYTIKKKNQKRF